METRDAIFTAVSKPSPAGENCVSGFHEGAFGVFGQDRKEHTSELQSHLNLVCRLLLEKKKHSASGYKRNVGNWSGSCLEPMATRSDCADHVGARGPEILATKFVGMCWLEHHMSSTSQCGAW